MRRLCLLVVLAAAACSKRAPDAPLVVATPLVVEGRRIDVQVTAQGYEPNTIAVQAGEQVTLVFTRTIESHCLSEVQIASAKIKRPLPLHQPVALPFKADRSGEVVFACGMDMVHGIITVQ